MWWLSVARFAVQKLGVRSSAEQEDYFFDEVPTVARDFGPAPAGTIGHPDWHRAGQALVPGHDRQHADELVYTAFDASQPVEHPAGLRGRDADLNALLVGVILRRNHGIVAGRRGSGKTSLVRSFGQCADSDGAVVLYSACDNGTSFGDLMRDYLGQIPTSSLDPEDVIDYGKRVRALRPDATPNQVTSLWEKVRFSQVIIICDEFDRVTQRDLQSKISSLMKLLSDSRLPIRFLLAGDRSAFENIIRGHASLSRHVTLVRTDPLSAQAMSDLLEDCAHRCGLAFSPDGLALLCDVACGSPYHARLFGLHAALTTLGGHSRMIGSSEVLAGLTSAFEEWSLLNEESSHSCLAIARGAHGDPAPFVAIARLVAETSGDVGEATPMFLTAEQQRALGPVLESTKGLVQFRDPVAPQFLVAICRVVATATTAPFVQRGLTRA